MKFLLHTLLLLHILVIISCASSKQKKQNAALRPIVHPKHRYPNPGYVEDRKKVSLKPLIPDLSILNQPKPYHPAWMDYCDPYHCNDYFKLACGLNRRNNKFQWFQSACHLILNNKCANYRGFLKFQPVETKYCSAYVMFALREGCPDSCPDEEKPVCAINVDGNKPVVFKNRCQLYAKNCGHKLQQYVEIAADVCLRDVNLVVGALEAITDQELKLGRTSTEESDASVENKYYIE